MNYISILFRRLNIVDFMYLFVLVGNKDLQSLGHIVFKNIDNWV